MFTATQAYASHGRSSWSQRLSDEPDDGTASLVFFWVCTGSVSVFINMPGSDTQSLVMGDIGYRFVALRSFALLSISSAWSLSWLHNHERLLSNCIRRLLASLFTASFCGSYQPVISGPAVSPLLFYICEVRINPPHPTL